MKKILSIVFILVMTLSLTACSKSELEEAKKRVETLTSELETLKSENETLKAEKEELEKENSELAAKVEEMSERLEEQEAAMEELNIKLEEMQDELISALKKASETAESKDDKKSEKAPRDKSKKKEMKLSKAGKEFKEFYLSNYDKGINNRAFIKLAELAFSLTENDVENLGIGAKSSADFFGDDLVVYNDVIAFKVSDTGKVDMVQLYKGFNTNLMGMTKTEINAAFGEPSKFSEGEDMLTGEYLITDEYKLGAYLIRLQYEKDGAKKVLKEASVMLAN